MTPTFAESVFDRLGGDLWLLIPAFVFAVFAGIFAFTFLLLMLVSLGVFVGLGFSLAADSGDKNQAGIGIAGGIFAVIFYLVLGAIFVVPAAMAGWKAFKLRPNARVWGTIAAILVLGIMPLGTALGVYALARLEMIEVDRLVEKKQQYAELCKSLSDKEIAELFEAEDANLRFRFGGGMWAEFHE